MSELLCRRVQALHPDLDIKSLVESSRLSPVEAVSKIQDILYSGVSDYEKIKDMMEWSDQELNLFFIS